MVDFVDDCGGILCAEILDDDADVFAIALFEVYIFGDDWVVGVANDEELGLGRHTCDLTSLTFLDEAGEF